MTTPPENPRTRSKRRLLAVIIAIAVLLVAMFFSRPPRSSSQSGPNGGAAPDACASAMIAAEKEGNVDAYLDCFTGQLRNKLESRMAEKSRERLAAELRSGAADLTGHVTIDVKINQPNEATLVLERVYSQHNERHQVKLRREFGDWRIVEINPLERFVMEIPYGTPVAPLPDDSEPEKSPP